MPHSPAGTTTVNSVGIARLAGVGRAAVSNWRRRYPDFPAPVGGAAGSPLFDLDEVREWLRRTNKLAADESPEAAVEAVWNLLDPLRERLGGADAVALLGAALAVRERGADPAALPDGELRGQLLACLDTGTAPPELPGAEEWRQPLLDAADRLGELGPAPDAFERLHQRYLTSVARHFFADTPQIGALIAELAAPAGGTVFDPSCGSGTLLHAVAGRAPGAALRGQEIDPGAARLAAVRLQLAGARLDIRVGDSLRADAFDGLRADAVVAHPPFNQADWGFEELSLDPRWRYGTPARKEPELAWVQHALAHTRPGGTAVVVLPPTVASRGSGRRVRRELIRRGALHAVIALPPGLAPPMGVPLMLWVLRNPEDGAAPAGGVLLFDASDGRADDLRGETARPWPATAERVAAVYRAFAEDPESVAEVPGSHRVVPLADLLDEAVDVSPGRHVQRPGADAGRLTETRDDLMRLSEDLVTSLPGLRPAAGTLHQAMTTLGELSRIGGLEVVYRRTGEDPGDDGPSLPALTGEDVEHDAAPSGRVRLDENTVRLRPGDVVLPRIARRPVARVVTDEQAALHGSTYLLRPDPEVVDPWFLAGFLTGSGACAAAASTSRPGVTRVTELRKVEVPRLPLADQRAYGEAFRRLTEFRRTLRRTTEVGDRLWRLLTEGLAVGTLRPGRTDGLDT
ncbi:N-6 DNA methylase [Thermobifida alba]|uniref:N-6 DNA methylase n=1 Tax=Thermobifida alba TaxID=53522 RepID=A0ABY4L9H3_THEAE|nr:N-6 DNA methylase [Thermobifida alba]UPT22757.1 N-6 DNA methylase [Thermobifida alba]